MTSLSFPPNEICLPSVGEPRRYLECDVESEISRCQMDNGCIRKASNNQSTLFDVSDDFTTINLQACHFAPCRHDEIKSFVETWHYSHYADVQWKYEFKLSYEGNTIGAMIFAIFSKPNAWKKYGDNIDEVLELRRLCCVDKTPKNTESYFIGKALRWLTLNTGIKTIISYADPSHGHEGTIYKASNFQHVGMTGKNKAVVWKGVEYDIRSLTIDRPYSVKIHDALKTGEAEYIDKPGKHIYIYDLNTRRKSKPYCVVKATDLFGCLKKEIS